MPEALPQLLPARRRAVREGGRFNLIFSEMINNSGGVVRERKRSNPTFFPFLSTGCQHCQSHMRVSHLWLLSLEAPAWGRHLIAGWKMKSWMIDISHERAVGTPTAEIGASRGSRMIRPFLKEGVSLTPSLPLPAIKPPVTPP